MGVLWVFVGSVVGAQVLVLCGARASVIMLCVVNRISLSCLAYFQFVDASLSDSYVVVALLLSVFWFLL